MTAIPIITVTGTKGKTTVVNLVSLALKMLGSNVVHVDTSGHFLNGVRKSSAEQSMEVWGIRTVTAAPGRYLFEYLVDPRLSRDAVAVLESSFSSGSKGLGYSSHKVGVFLNVFDDHINPLGSIKNRAELAEAKSFIFSSIAKNGYAVFNADDQMVCSVLHKISPDKNITLIPCGTKFEHFDIAKHVQDGGSYVKLQESTVSIVDTNGETEILNVDELDWAFNGRYLPLNQNLMFMCAALYAFNNSKVDKSLLKVFREVKLPTKTGRLVLFKTKSGTQIIADYAHEKKSLTSIAGLGRSLLPAGGRLWGVVRLSHERPDEVIQETGKVIGGVFDSVVVYDKIDGVLRSPGPPYIKIYPQVIGRVSSLLFEAIRTVNPDVVRVVREDKAIEFAASRARPEDVVVVILNDDVGRSLGFIKHSFNTHAN